MLLRLRMRLQLRLLLSLQPLDLLLVLQRVLLVRLPLLAMLLAMLLLLRLALVLLLRIELVLLLLLLLKHAEQDLLVLLELLKNERFVVGWHCGSCLGLRDWGRLIKLRRRSSIRRNSIAEGSRLRAAPTGSKKLTGQGCCKGWHGSGSDRWGSGVQLTILLVHCSCELDLIRRGSREISVAFIEHLA